MNKLIRTGLTILPFCLAGCADDESGRGSNGTGGTGSGTGDAGPGDDGSADDGGTGSSDSGGGGTGASGTGSDTGPTGTGSSGTGTGTDSSGTGTGTGSSGTGTGTGSSGTGTGTDSSGTGTGTSSATTGATTSGTTTTTGVSTTTGGPTTTGISTTFTMEPCDTAEVTVEPVPPRIMFVLDKSGSMYTNDWDHDGDGGTPDITRWNTLHNTVTSVVNTWDNDIWFGAKLYPAYDSEIGDCDVDPVEVPIAANNAANVIAGIPVATSWLGGGTPMETGLSLAIDWIKANVLDTLPRAMILVADGEISSAQCTGESYSDALALVTNAWNTDDIATYVIGIDISNNSTADTQLTGLANAGGKPLQGQTETYYQIQNGGDLDQAMLDIISDTLSCVVDLDPTPPEPDNIEVWIGGVEVPEVTDCATQNGWMYVPPTPPWDTIEFCGTACDDLRAEGDADIKYFCTPG